MKWTFILVLTLIGLSLTATNAFSLRCGQDLVNIGDLKHKVLLTCGQPFSKEIIGYIDQERSGDRIRVMKIEEWIVESNGNYYSLEFEGNMLVKEVWVERKE